MVIGSGGSLGAKLASEFPGADGDLGREANGSRERKRIVCADVFPPSPKKEQTLRVTPKANSANNRVLGHRSSILVWLHQERNWKCMEMCFGVFCVSSNKCIAASLVSYVWITQA